MALLAGKTALVTGAAQGLGLAQARKLAAEGARVIAADVRADEGEENTLAARSEGLEMAFERLNVTEPDSWSQCLEACRSRYGPPDILVNNAGIVLPRMPLEERAIEDWDRIIAVNLRGVFLGIRAVIPIYRGKGGGAIINIASIAALAQYEIQEPAYATSKGAVVTLTKIVAAQYAHENIRCNAICPGPTDGGMLRTFLDTPEKLAARRQKVPMQRFGTLDEISDTVAFLASDRSGFTTGAIIPVDGGTVVQ
jgi:NAD(P)-dependent dehydrogenase (short-subunit alcohol dehydrogenase family)